jgi:dolichol-phosphate mannosyltransferase
MKSSFTLKNLIMNILKKYREFTTFLIVGTIVSVINLVLLYVFVDLVHLEKRFLSPSLALEISILISFALNDKFTFRSKNKKFGVKLAKFHLAAISGFLLNLTIYNILLQYVPLNLIAGRFDYLLAQMVAILIVVFWNYFINSRWTWKENK